jgi:subtilisin-like proprotein convertase family protein
LVTVNNPVAIPDDGLRLLVTGPGVPGNLASVRTLPSVGPHADTPTATLPLVDFGFGTNTAGYNLTNKGALIQRDTNATFATKINRAAQVGAAFAVIYNFSADTPTTGAPGGDELTPLGGTDFVPIPAVFIGHSDGEALKALFQTNNDALARIHLNNTSVVFTVTNTLLCEHVGLRVMTDHPLRGDLRITLVSPSGTRSVLQRFNADEEPGPIDWTYYSTHHFGESSAGAWTAYFSDEFLGATGNVQSVSLQLSGVSIMDTDKDGLDDIWEIIHFACLDETPKNDLDRDGYSNAREQLMGTDPNAAGLPFPVDLSRWNQTLARLSWPGSSNYNYSIWGGTNVAALNLITNVQGRWPETEWFTPYNNPTRQFFRVQAVPVP